MSDWQRPGDVTFPKIWSRFDGKKQINGMCRKYVIQDATEEHVNDIKSNMIKYFLNEEPTCKYLNAAKDESFIEELHGFWDWCLQHKLSLVCLIEDENLKPKMAGSLLLFRCIPDISATDIKNDKWKKIINIMEYLSSQKDPYSTFGITEYLTDMGLLVVPEFRGDGVAEHLLNTCDSICKAFDFPALIMSFTSIASQTLADRIGFKDLYSITYENLRQIDYEKYGIDDIEEHTKSARYMYKLYK